MTRHASDRIMERRAHAVLYLFLWYTYTISFPWYCIIEIALFYSHCIYVETYVYFCTFVIKCGIFVRSLKPTES